MAYLIFALIGIGALLPVRGSGPVERRCSVCGEPLGGNQINCPRGPHN
jgi:predicted nucleic acid-binding Zn ribbon protein